MVSPHNFASVCYLPPPNIGHPKSFLANIKNFPPKHPLFIYSDYDYSADYKGAIKLAASPEIARCDTNKMATNNLVFFMGVRIAAMQGLSHLMILEPDCRVNRAGFDDEIFQEMMAKNVNAEAAGSIAIFNPCSYNRQAAERFERFLADTRGTRPVPFSVTGSSNLAEHRDSCVFPNGAFAIYRMDTLVRLLPEIVDPKSTCIELAQKTTTWDYFWGIKAWEEFKDGVYDRVVSIDKIYSGYGQVMSSEEERKQWLIDEKIIGVHQIKSDWIGPEPKQLVPFVAPSPEFKSKVEIFICTFSKDFVYLKYCLLSIKKFARGFSGVTILVPTPDVKELRALIAEVEIPYVTVKSGYEWAKKGMCWHLAQECRADEWCPHADYIAHFDSDTLFTKPVTPETFFKAGKPLLRYEPFSTLALRHPGTLNWKIAAENALPFSVADEAMRGLPHFYGRNLYAATRQAVEEKTKMPFNDYVKSGKNEYPQNFCEYVTLGAVALKYFADDYTLCDLSKEPNPDRSPFPVVQLWSHGPIDQEQEIWIDGLKRNIVPIKLIEEILK